MMESHKSARKTVRPTKKNRRDWWEGRGKRGSSFSWEWLQYSDGEVRCFCNRQREAGEMVQCKVCAGWFHLECLRMPLEQVQLRAFRSYFGVPRSHPRSSLLAEMEVLSVGWEARMRCIGFWHRILTDQRYHERLIQRLAYAALMAPRRNQWMGKLWICLEAFGLRLCHSGWGFREESKGDVEKYCMQVYREGLDGRPWK